MKEVNMVTTNMKLLKKISNLFTFAFGILFALITIFILWIYPSFKEGEYYRKIEYLNREVYTFSTFQNGHFYHDYTLFADIRKNTIVDKSLDEEWKYKVHGNKIIIYDTSGSYEVIKQGLFGKKVITYPIFKVKKKGENLILENVHNKKVRWIFLKK